MSEPGMTEKISRDRKMIKRRLVALIENDLTQKKLADLLGLKVTSVSIVINGYSNSYVVRAALAVLTCKPYQYLWGVPCPVPNRKQEEQLREKLGVEWTPGDITKPFRKVAKS